MADSKADTRVPRHEFRTDNAAELVAPIIKSTKDVLDHIETSEDDRYDALMSTLTLAKWRSLTDPTAGEVPTWEAWVTAMQVGCAMFASGTAAEGPVPWRRQPGRGEAPPRDRPSGLPACR